MIIVYSGLRTIKKAENPELSFSAFLLLLWSETQFRPNTKITFLKKKGNNLE